MALIQHDTSVGRFVFRDLNVVFRISDGDRSEDFTMVECVERPRGVVAAYAAEVASKALAAPLVTIKKNVVGSLGLELAQRCPFGTDIILEVEALTSPPGGAPIPVGDLELRPADAAEPGVLPLAGPIVLTGAMRAKRFLLAPRPGAAVPPLDGVVLRLTCGFMRSDSSNNWSGRACVADGVKLSGAAGPEEDPTMCLRSL